MKFPLKTWIKVDKDSDFPLNNLPYGIVKLPSGKIVAASRIGDTVIDLAAMQVHNYFEDITEIPFHIFEDRFLNNFIALGKPVWVKLRRKLIDLFLDSCPIIRDNSKVQNSILHNIKDVEPLMPVSVGDYTDFYSSIEHATNVGMMFRDPENALLPNWRHLPVGYHGRSSSVVVSGTNIHRPKGQLKPPDAESPVFGPSKLMDFELEMAFITGKSTQLGETISIDKAEEYIFGLVLFNDLSARDIQAWEYVPLGPFLGKSFGSVISPWIVTLEALAPFKTKSPVQTPKVLPYLRGAEEKSYDINLEVSITPENKSESVVCRSNFKYMYWNMSQQLAHQTINGCNINVGDMYASGTISGPTADSFGSMLELSWKGTKPVLLNGNEERRFLLDNDTVTMKAYAEKNGVKIGFGEVNTKILPAKKLNSKL